MLQNTILLVAGDTIPGDDICIGLQRNGWVVWRAATVDEARQWLASVCPDVVLADLGLPDIAGSELIARLGEAGSGAKLIVVGGDGASAFDALKAGAWYCLPKLPNQAELELLLERACEVRRMEQVLSFYRDREARGAGLAALLGESAPMRATKALIRKLLDAERVGDGDLPVVLVTGEIGTGKEFVARALHVDGVRAGGPFVAVSCATLAPESLEAELFGLEQGACSGVGGRRGGSVAAAGGGTLFLDEIGACDLAMQARLVELIETCRAGRSGAAKDFLAPLRIVCATSRNLDAMVRAGGFRSDLRALLCATTIPVPPLRERGEDSAILAHHFLGMFGRQYGKPGFKFNTAAVTILRGYAWPGNVSELRNTLEQTVLLATADLITPNQLAICPGLTGSCDRDFQTLDSYCMSVPASGVSVPDVEHDLVVKMLEKTDWNVAKSARLLGLTRDQLRYRIEKLGLTRVRR